MFFKYIFLCALFKFYVNCIWLYISFYFFKTRYNIFKSLSMLLHLNLTHCFSLIHTRCPAVSLSHNLPLSSSTDGYTGCIPSSASTHHTALNILIPGLMGLKNSFKIRNRIDGSKLPPTMHEGSHGSLSSWRLPLSSFGNFVSTGSIK